jgi:V8-like Glu-specific endopeptidase
VRENDLADALDTLANLAIGLIGTDVSAKATELKTHIILQQNALKRLEQAAVLDIANPDDQERERKRIVYTILTLANSLERLDDTSIPDLTTGDFPIDDLASLEKLVSGQRTLKSLAWYRKALSCASSVCRVVTPKSSATGFLVSGGILLTNNHVIGSASEALQSYVEFNFEEDTDGALSDVVRYQLSPDNFITSPQLDCSAISIVAGAASPPLDTWGVVRCDRGAKVAKGDHVTIIQHPYGAIKQICSTANQVVNVFGNKLQYTTDTLPGSSGSPVFNDDWCVVAIHHAGGYLRANKWGKRIFANQGVLISSLLDDPIFSGLFR